MTGKITKKNAMLRYCLIQLLLWSQFCCCTSFATVYMNGKGVSNALVGVAFSIGNLLAFIIQPMLSSIADRGKKVTVTQMAIMMYIAMFVLEGITMINGIPIIAVTLVYSLIFMIIQNTPVVVNGLGIYYMDRGASINYGVSRGLGSVFFSLLSLLLGRLITVTSYRTVAYAQIILAVATILALTLMPTPRDVLSDNISPEDNANNSDTSYISFIKRNPSFMLYFLGMGLIMILYNFYNNFTINVVKNVGAGSEEMGVLLAIAAIAEVPAMFAFDYLSKKFPIKNLLILSSIGFIVRGSLMTFAVGVTGLYMSSAVQFMGFALFMPGMVKLSDKYFGEGDKNKAQGLLQSTMSFGAIIGSIVGGSMIDVTGVKSVMGVMLIVSVIGTIMAVFALEKFCGKKVVIENKV